MSVGKIIRGGALPSSVGKPVKCMELSIPKGGSITFKRSSNGGYIVDVWDASKKNNYTSDQYVFTNRSDFELV